MRAIRRFLGLFFLATTLLAPVATIGCAARVRVYDQDHADWHYWNNGEEHAYRSYLTEKHQDYRDFHNLKPAEQSDYWNWRHAHPDSH